MSYKSELIRKLFSDRLKKDELKDLSEIDMIEQQNESAMGGTKSDSGKLGRVESGNRRIIFGRK